jgi:hypothetical protein
MLRERFSVLSSLHPGKLVTKVVCFVTILTIPAFKISIPEYISKIHLQKMTKMRLGISHPFGGSLNSLQFGR